MMFFTNLLIFEWYKHIFKFCSEQHKHIPGMFLVCELDVQSDEGNDIVWTLDKFAGKIKSENLR